MALFPIHNYYIFNNQLEQTNKYQPEENTDSVYEVLRIIRGVPLFLTDHLKRLINSANLARLEIRFPEKEIEESLTHLIKANQVSEGNILISYKKSLIAFFIPHKYPGRALYENGINLGILHAERPNPNAKVFQTTVRQKADEMKLVNNFYEVLLVDQNEKITEGSSSNVFFVEQNNIVTPPASEVLPGITRSKIIFLAQKLNIKVEEKSIYLSELGSYEAVFITGTSPKILPVKLVGDQDFDVENKLTKQLAGAFDDLIEEYISGR